MHGRTIFFSSEFSAHRRMSLSFVSIKLEHFTVTKNIIDHFSFFPFDAIPSLLVMSITDSNTSNQTTPASTGPQTISAEDNTTNNSRNTQEHDTRKTPERITIKRALLKINTRIPLETQPLPENKPPTPLKTPSTATALEFYGFSLLANGSLAHHCGLIYDGKSWIDR